MLTEAFLAAYWLIGVFHRTQGIKMVTAIFTVVFINRHDVSPKFIWNAYYNTIMKETRGSLKPIRTGGGTDLAFAVMVLASFFTMFSTIKDISVGKLTVIILMGVVYLANGVYGYAYCANRGSYPLVGVYFALQILLGGGIILLGESAGFNAILLLPLAGHSVVLLPELTRYFVNGVIVVLYALCMRWMSGGWEIIWTNLPIFIAGQVFILVFTQMAVGEEQARHEVQDLVRELEEANRNLRIYATRAEDLAVIQERNRLAREIHDGLGHHLTALNMQIRGARAILRSNSGKADELLSNAEGLTQKALVDVRQSVSSLREDVTHGTLEEQIESILGVCESNNVQVDFQILGSPRPTSQEIIMALTRAAQECVNNVLKHSSATRVSVELDFSSLSLIRFIFSDNGRGSDELAGGYGLIGMKERVSLLEGEITIRSVKGKGFCVEICLPG